MDNATEIRANIEDHSTALDMNTEEGEAAIEIVSDIKAENDSISDDRAIRQTLSAIRQIRENKQTETASKASYKETKTLEAVLNTIRIYRAERAATDEEIEKIRYNEKYRDSYKIKLINEQRQKFREKANSSREVANQLIDEIINDRVAYDKGFFTDSDRLGTANKIIEVLKNAGKNISPEDFANLVEPIFGDAAACRYVSASIKDSPVLFKKVIDSMGIKTESAFDSSRQLLHNLFSGTFSAYGIEQTLLAEAAKVGIALTVTDYSEPIYSENRNKPLEPEINEDELLEYVKRSMRGY